MAAINSRRRLLLYLEECAYLTGGAFSTEELSENARKTLEQWQKDHFIQCSQIRRGHALVYGGYRVKLSDAAIAEAHKHRASLIASRWKKHSPGDTTDD